MSSQMSTPPHDDIYVIRQNDLIDGSYKRLPIEEMIEPESAQTSEYTKKLSRDNIHKDATDIFSMIKSTASRQKLDYEQLMKQKELDKIYEMVPTLRTANEFLALSGKQELSAADEYMLHHSLESKNAAVTLDRGRDGHEYIQHSDQPEVNMDSPLLKMFPWVKHGKEMMFQNPLLQGLGVPLALLEGLMSPSNVEVVTKKDLAKIAEAEREETILAVNSQEPQQIVEFLQNNVVEPEMEQHLLDRFYRQNHEVLHYLAHEKIIDVPNFTKDEQIKTAQGHFTAAMQLLANAKAIPSTLFPSPAELQHREYPIDEVAYDRLHPEQWKDDVSNREQALAYVQGFNSGLIDDNTQIGKLLKQIQTIQHLLQNDRLPLEKRVKLRDLQEQAFEEYHRLDEDRYQPKVTTAEEEYNARIQPNYSHPQGLSLLPIGRRLDHTSPIITENYHIGRRKHVCGIQHSSLWSCFLDHNYDPIPCRDYGEYYSACMRIASDNVKNHRKSWYYD